jgi:hypothetical protein
MPATATSVASRVEWVFTHALKVVLSVILVIVCLPLCLI